jgi:hypothetical protein
MMNFLVVKEHVFVAETVYNFDYFLNTFTSILSIAVTLIVVYGIVNLYRKLIKFLDANS